MLLSKLKTKGVPVCIHYEMPDYIYIDTLWIPKHMRGKGEGSKFFAAKLEELYKKYRMPMRVDAMELDGVPIEKLLKFYMKHGFTMRSAKKNVIYMEKK